jgi:hypothetical protein
MPNSRPAPWVITEADGSILDRFCDETDRDEALLTGEYPDDAEPAYVNDWVWVDA